MKTILGIKGLMKKTRQQIAIEGDTIKLYRTLMGIKQKDFAEKFGIDQGNYSKMEAGRENNPNLLPIVKEIFNEWRINKIKELQKQIDYLNSI